MSLYLILNLASISVPFLVSFHPRIQLYKRWPELFSAIGLTLIPFIVWDIWFTKSGYWGFNPAYLMGVEILGLPLEEWLFFIAIPYACVFTHYALVELWPNFKLSDQATKIITYALLGLFSIVGVVFYDRWYTLIDMIFGLVILSVTYKLIPSFLNRFYWTFLFMLIPFFIVNGILTGSGIVDEVVWYNNSENLGIRMGTIPVEDSVYALSMILLNLFLMNFVFSKKKV
jgi:lycopene cyclase domain-containing protein